MNGRVGGNRSPFSESGTSKVCPNNLSSLMRSWSLFSCTSVKVTVMRLKLSRNWFSIRFHPFYFNLSYFRGFLIIHPLEGFLGPTQAVTVLCRTRWIKHKPKSGSGISTAVSCIMFLENSLTAGHSCGDNPKCPNQTLIILRQLDLSLSSLHLSEDPQKCMGGTAPSPYSQPAVQPTYQGPAVCCRRRHG